MVVENDAGALSAEALQMATMAIRSALTAGKPPDRLTLSNGVVLKLRPIPPWALNQGLGQLKQPPIPTWRNPDKERDEPNPNDPDYLAAMDRYGELRIEMLHNLAMALGTEVETIPDGFPRPEDDGWIEELEVVGIAVPREPPKARYMAWLRLRALERAVDITLITALPLLLAGISETEVMASMASFRSDEGRRADPEPSASDVRRLDGDNLPADLPRTDSGD